MGRACFSSIPYDLHDGLKDHVYIFEFKMDGSADEALQQIEQKGYAKPYLNDPRQVLRIGMNFSSETRTIAEWMVR